MSQDRIVTINERQNDKTSAPRQTRASTKIATQPPESTKIYVTTNAAENIAKLSFRVVTNIKPSIDTTGCHDQERLRTRNRPIAGTAYIAARTKRCSRSTVFTSRAP